MRAVVVVAFFAVAACSKHEPPSPPAPAASAIPAPAPSAPASSLAVAPSASTSAEPPTEEDFEDEASQAVTAKSLDSQLDALEKEIQAD
jgi:hypothetical protein